MNIYSGVDRLELTHRFFSRTFNIEKLSIGNYMNRFLNFCLFLIFPFVSFSPTIIARDLSGAEPNESKIHPQANLAQDSVPSHLINWPLHLGVQQTGEIDASFDSYGTFGSSLSSGPFDFSFPPYCVSFVTPSNSYLEYLFPRVIQRKGQLLLSKITQQIFR